MAKEELEQDQFFRRQVDDPTRYNEVGVARLDERPLAESLQDCAVALFASTAAGLDALSLGRCALRFRADALLDVDPSDVLGDDWRQALLGPGAERGDDF